MALASAESNRSLDGGRGSRRVPGGGYVAFGAILLGQFLIFPNWILLVYLVLGIAVFHRQVLREEAYLRQHYGPAYADYCGRVRRYL